MTMTRALARAGLVVSGAFLISRLLGWVRYLLIVNALPTDALSAPAMDAVMAAAAAPARGAIPDDKSAGPLRATLAMAVGVRAHREAADRVLAGLKRDLGLPMITLPRIPTAEIGPAIIAELTPHLAEQIR